jgi:predicted phage terminase large subunit-like protein
MSKRGTSLTVSQAEARLEVGRILLARDDLAHFGEYVTDGGWWKAYELHHYIAFWLGEVLKYLETGGKEGIQFLMLLTPPQHGKSWLVSRLFPAFALGRMPNLRFLDVSYGADLASDNSRAVRNLITSPKYREVFGDLSPDADPVTLSSDSRAVAAWDLASPHRGGMVAAGNGGALSGRQRGVLLWDDPIKDHRAAESQDVRDDAWDFYRSVLRPRSMAGVLVMTHWHPDDPAGRIMKQMLTNPGADQWKIISLPGLWEDGVFAVSEDEQREKMIDGVYMPISDPLGRSLGDVLCPAIMSKEEMLKIRAADEYYFTALYQQLPYPKSGQKYKRDWFRPIPQLPEDVKLKYVVRYWDKANSTKGDYTAGALMGFGSDGYFYFLDMVRGRWSSFERDQWMKKTAELDNLKYGKVNVWHQQDPGSAGKDSAEATNRLLMGFAAKFETVSGDKEVRSEPLESAFQGGLVKILQGAWNAAFIDECIAFPRGHDDQVDAGASAYSKLLEMVGTFRKSRIG